MDVQASQIVATGTDPDTGYDSFRLGGFTFRRDEYFAEVVLREFDGAARTDPMAALALLETKVST